MNNVTIKSVTTVSGIAGSFIGEPTAEVTLLVKGNASSVEAVRQYVEQRVGATPQRKRSENERSWSASLTLEAARQDEIAVGDIVRCYDFPGSSDTVYCEGVVKLVEPERDRILTHVTREVWLGEEGQVDRFEIWSPLGASMFNGAPCVFLIAKREVRS